MSKKGTNWTEADLIQKGLTTFEDSIYKKHKRTNISGVPIEDALAASSDTAFIGFGVNHINTKKKSKYNNKKVVIDGIQFDSTKEGERYKVLKLHEKIGKIFKLELQPVYECIVNGMLICRYKGDFKYNTIDPITTVVEDVKGMRTPIYKLKKKLMKSLFNIEIKET